LEVSGVAGEWRKYGIRQQKETSSGSRTSPFSLQAQSAEITSRERARIQFCVKVPRPPLLMGY